MQWKWRRTRRQSSSEQQRPAAGAREFFHGAGSEIPAGEQLHTDDEGYAYLGTTERWADAFAYRDAASLAIERVVFAVVGRAAPASSLTEEVSQVHGFIHRVNIASPGAVEPDPDFPNATESQRTMHACTVVESWPGSITSWRELNAVVGEHWRWAGCGCPGYDADGYLLPPERWRSWGYTAEDLRPLGPWYQPDGVWAEGRRLFLVSEFSLPFVATARFGDTGPAIKFLREHGMYRPLTEANAARAQRTWWR